MSRDNRLLWEHSSAGRASALQAGGHRFEPCSAHHLFFGPVVQLVRTLACHARGRRFEPDPGRQKYADVAHLVERHLAKVEVAGSSPVIRSSIQSTIWVLFLLSFFIYSCIYYTIRRYSQVVRQESAKLPFLSSNLSNASTKSHSLVRMAFLLLLFIFNIFCNFF